MRDCALDGFLLFKHLSKVIGLLSSSRLVTCTWIYCVASVTSSLARSCAVTAIIRLITFDLDDTLWDARPALEAGEAAQRSYLSTRFPSLSLDIVSKETLSNVRQALLHEQPELVHKISLFRETFIKRLLQSQGVPDIESTIAASEAFAAFISHRHEGVALR